MKNTLLFLALLALGIAYIMYLDYGCDPSGVMTWHGKVCFEDLIK